MTESENGERRLKEFLGTKRLLLCPHCSEEMGAADFSWCIARWDEFDDYTRIDFRCSHCRFGIRLLSSFSEIESLDDLVDALERDWNHTLISGEYLQT